MGFVQSLEGYGKTLEFQESNLLRRAGACDAQIECRQFRQEWEFFNEPNRKQQTIHLGSLGHLARFKANPALEDG